MFEVRSASTEDSDPNSGRTSNRLTVPDAVVTRLAFARLIGLVTIAVAVIGGLLLYPRLQTEDIQQPSFLDGHIRLGETRVIVSSVLPHTSTDGSQEKLTLGEMTVSLNHQEDYFLAMRGSFGRNGESALLVTAAFTQYRYLRDLTLRVLEPSRALELQWNQERTTAHLLVRDEAMVREVDFGLPTPILLRDVGESDFMVVSPLSLQRLLTNDGKIMLSDTSSETDLSNANLLPEGIAEDSKIPLKTPSLVLLLEEKLLRLSAPLRSGATSTAGPQSVSRASSGGEAVKKDLEQ